MAKKRIYMDFATTTPLDPSVEHAMKPFWSRDFGNPSSLHAEGVHARDALALARTCIARILEAHADELVFTSNGTEANSLALRGYVEQLASHGAKLARMHIIASAIEHSSVRATLAELAVRGVRVDECPVDERGIVRLDELEKLICPETMLISVMTANNEIGTIQPIGRIAALIKRANESRKALPIRFHTDACQAALYENVSQNRLGADMISLDAHKLYGPKGVGLLYVRRGVELAPQVSGGGQERGRRSGTEALPLIAGFARALELSKERRENDGERIAKLRDFFFERLVSSIPHALVNGDRRLRLPNNVNISILGLDAEFAVLELDALGIACSAKSACLERERESFVVKALARADGSERSSLRFTLGRETKKSDVDSAVKALIEVVRRHDSRTV